MSYSTTTHLDAFGLPLAIGDLVELRSSGDLARVTDLATKATVDLLPGAMVDNPGERLVSYDAIARVEV